MVTKQQQTALSMGKNSKAKKFLQMHVLGTPLTHNQAILANCYDCMGGYADGRYECDNPSCALYRYTLYKGRHLK